MDHFTRATQNPFSPPSWRWDLAGKQPAQGRRSIGADDDWILLEARRYRAAVASGSSAAFLTKRWPVLHQAVLLAEAEGPRRWEIEARLLAGQTSEEIGAACAYDPAVVDAFADLFFDIRPNLDSVDWISLQVIGPRALRGFEPGDVKGIWRSVGFFLGPAALDVVIAVTQELELPPTTRKTLGPGEQYLLRLDVRLTIAAMTRGAEREIELLLRLRNVARRKLLGPEAASTMEGSEKLLRSEVDLLGLVNGLKRSAPRAQDLPTPVSPKERKDSNCATSDQKETARFAVGKPREAAETTASEGTGQLRKPAATTASDRVPPERSIA
jgi:hypothetical protein